MVLAISISVMAVLVVAGAVRDDVTISGSEGRATADVLTVSRVFAAISFTTPDGTTHSPKLGVFYPTGLAAGQHIDVEYSTDNPDLVRVAGRDARLSLIPAASLAVFAWVVALGLLAALRRVDRRRARGPDGRG